MPIVIPATRKRNAIWPMSRTSKGWDTATMAKRYNSALRHLIRTQRGTIIWAPDYGTRLETLRTQGITAELASFIEEDIRGAISLWIPDIRLIGLNLEANPDEETLEVHIAWGIPNMSGSAVGATSKDRFAFGPYDLSVTV